MTKTVRINYYDLEERTLNFAAKVRNFLKVIPFSTSNIEDAKQLARSSGSVGANYIEANNFLSKKDFILRIKICRKEAKESRYWLILIDCGNYENAARERNFLANEATELMKIFGAILRNSTQEE